MEAMDGRIVHAGPGEGTTVRMPGGERVTLKVAAGQTGGAYSLSEVAVPPGAGPQPHVQHREDECFYVLEGGFEFSIDGGGLGAGPGSLIYVPKGHPHAFENTGEGVGRLLVFQTPGGAHERFVEEAGEPVPDGSTPPPGGPSDAGRIAEIAARYGVEMVPPTAHSGARGAREGQEDATEK